MLTPVENKRVNRLYFAPINDADSSIEMRNKRERELAHKIALVSEAIIEGMDAALHNRLGEDRDFLKSLIGKDLEKVREDLLRELYEV
jgi:hypothetical protein